MTVASKIVADFIRGLTGVGLARKYGKTVKQIQNILRKNLIK